MLSRVAKTGRFVFEVRCRFPPGRRVERRSAEWLKRELQAMGPTYIKIGQFMSSRKDLFDPTLVAVLRGLQDAVDPAPEAEVKQIILDRLGTHVSRLARVSSAPLACASIGQVHLAELKSGQRVVLKVRRPGVVEDLDADITILMGILSMLDLLNTQNVRETKELLHDFKTWCAAEMDYTQELANWKKMRAASKPSLILPQLYDELCFEDFVAMSYVPSTKLVVHGVLHGDPHEGNLGIHQDGRIVLYDMGNVIYIDAETRVRLKHMLFEIVMGNYDDAVDLMRRISLFEVRDSARVRQLLELYGDYIRTVDINVLLQSPALTDISSGELPVKFSGTVFRIVRVFGLLEGQCKDLDPSFSYEPIISRYMQVLGGDTDYVSYKMTNDIKKVARLLLQSLDKA